MSAWAKGNLPTIVGWLVALLAAAYIGGGQVSAISARLDAVEVEGARHRDSVERLDRIVSRLDGIVERLSP